MIQGHSPHIGSGSVNPLGTVSSTVTLTPSGAEPVIYRGTVTLVGANGSITASLVGEVFGASVLDAPIHLTYKIISGTGAFAGDTGSGQALYQSTGSLMNGGFILTFGNSTLPPTGGA